VCEIAEIEKIALESVANNSGDDLSHYHRHSARLCSISIAARLRLLLRNSGPSVWTLYLTMGESTCLNWCSFTVRFLGYCFFVSFYSLAYYSQDSYTERRS